MGAVAGVTGTCPALTLTINGKIVVTDASTKYDIGTCDGWKTATQGAAGGALQPDGSIVAKIVRVGVANGPQAPSDQATVQGIVAGVAGACPAKSYTLDGKAVRVDAATTFEKGSCADVANGMRGGVIGKADSAGVILAKRAIVGPAQPTPGPTTPAPGPAMTVIQGVVAAVTGSCPALKFTVDGEPVELGPAPRFEGGTCADIKAGITVAAGGHMQASGVMLAIGVKFGGK